MPIYLLLARRTEALTVKTTVPTSCTPPFPKNQYAKRRLKRSMVRRLPACETFSRCDPKRHVMDATSNPQTAAEQARKNYQDVTTSGAAVPEKVRAMVEKAV